MSGILSFEMEVSAVLDELLSATPSVTPRKGAEKNEHKRQKKNECSNDAVNTLKSSAEKGTNVNETTDVAQNLLRSEEEEVSVNCRESGFEAEESDKSIKRIISLASGSRANCTLIEGGGARILIDFGLSCRMLGSFLKNYDLLISDIDAIFITHEHTDHVYGLSTLFKKYRIPVHMTEPSYLAYTRKAGFEYRDKITVHEVEFEEKIRGFTVSSCQVCHDSAACVSYFVEGNGISFCSCTDLGFLPSRVFKHISRAENIILESNHDVTLLESGEYPDDLKRRIRSRWGHLSNEQCGEVLASLVDSGVRRILLGHVSPENNDPRLALHSALAALEGCMDKVEYIDVAPRLEPIILFEKE